MKKLRWIGIIHGKYIDVSLPPRGSSGLSASPVCDPRVVEYLRNGVGVWLIPGWIVDPIGKPERLPFTPEVLTDGTWVWGNELVFCIQKYGLMPSAEFSEHVQRNEWRVPAVGDLAQIARAIPDPVRDMC
jgi:hypothetical protein